MGGHDFIGTRAAFERLVSASMALTHSNNTAPGHLGMQAPDFKLEAVDGKTYSLADFKNSRALLVVFMCNHCPYVIAVEDRLNKLAKDFGPRGLGMIGINSNNVEKYPADSFDAMKVRAREKDYRFAYAIDPTQEVARAYDAACTPDPYLFERVGERFVLRYHGRVDDNWKDPAQIQSHDLANAIAAVLEGRAVSDQQIGSMGCNIKWK